MPISCTQASLYVRNYELDPESSSCPNSDKKVAEIRATTTACPVSTPHTLGHRISILPEDPLSLITAYLDTESRRATRDASERFCDPQMGKKAFAIQRSYVIESLKKALRTLEKKLKDVGGKEQKAALDTANKIRKLLAASALECTMNLYKQEKLISQLLLNVRNAIYELEDFRESFSHDKELLEAFFLDIIFADETKLGSIVDEKTKNKSSTIEDLLNAERVALLLPELDRSSAFTKLIDAYNTKGELEESLRVADLLSPKVKPNAYYNIFDFCLKKGQYLDALRVAEMITFNAELKRKSLLKVIGQYLKDEMFKEAEELARSFSDSRLSARAFSKIVIAYNRKNRLSEGEKVFQEMMRKIKCAHLHLGQTFKYRYVEFDTLIKSIAKDLVAMSRQTEGSESEKLFKAAKKYTREISNPKVAKAVFL